MPRPSILRALLVVSVLWAAISGAKGQTPLHVGDPLLEISGQTLSGKNLTLPADAVGKPAVVSFSFSRTGGKDSTLWSEHIERDFPMIGRPYTLMMIEAAPKFVRGLIISGSKKGMSEQAQDRCIAMDHDEDAWKNRIGYTDENKAYVFLLGPDGHIRWKSSAAFSDAEYANLKKEIAQLQ